MCDPVSIAIATTVAAGGLKAYSQYQEGAATANYYKAVARQKESEGQAALSSAERQRNLIQDTAKEEGKAFSSEAAKLRSKQRAVLAAKGISGVTVEDITFDTSNKQSMDEAAIRYNADVRSWGVTEEAKEKNWLLRSEANQYKASAKQAKRKSYLEMGATLLGTAASVSAMWPTAGGDSLTKTSWSNYKSGGYAKSAVYGR